jgi:hypothetical protein
MEIGDGHHLAAYILLLAFCSREQKCSLSWPLGDSVQQVALAHAYKPRNYRSLKPASQGKFEGFARIRGTLQRKL